MDGRRWIFNTPFLGVEKGVVNDPMNGAFTPNYKRTILSQSSNVTDLGFISSSEKNAFLSQEWNADQNSFTGTPQAKVVNGALKVTYPSGSFKSPKTGGLQFIARPIPESDSMTLSYSVFVPSDFDFVKGGKLPGRLFN